MIKIPGVTFGLLVEDGNAVGEAVIGGDGLVGALLPGSVTVIIKKDPAAEARILNVDGEKNVQRMKPFAEMEWRKKITVELKPHLGFTVPKGDNSFRVLTCSADRKLVIYQVALISQEGVFYLTVDEQYRPALYIDEQTGNPVCPLFEGLPEYEYVPNAWPAIIPFLHDAAGGPDLNYLPSLFSYKGEPEVDVTGLTEHQGRVRFWNSLGGWGAVVFPGKGDVRVHWSQFQGRPEGGRSYLNPGEVVEAAAFRTPHNSGRLTMFTEEAVGVKLITSEDKAMTA